MPARTVRCLLPSRRSDWLRRLRRVPRALAGMLHRWNQRHDLAELDDRLLADIGVARAEVERECSRSPGSGWR